MRLCCSHSSSNFALQLPSSASSSSVHQGPGRAPLAAERGVMWKGREVRPIRFLHSLCLVAGVLSGCAATASSPINPMQPPDLPLGSIVLVQPNRFNEHLIRFEVPTEVVIRSQAELDSLWLGQPGIMEPSHPIRVDFSRFILLYVTMGRCPSGGYDISLRGAHEWANEIVVDIVEETPGAGCLRTCAITYPTALALLPRTEKSIWV